MCTNKLINELNKIIELYILPDTDICWTNYESIQDAIDDIQKNIML